MPVASGLSASPRLAGALDVVGDDEKDESVFCSKLSKPNCSITRTSGQASVDQAGEEGQRKDDGDEAQVEGGP